MAYLTIHKLTGDPTDLLGRKQARFDPVVNRLAPQYGAISTVTGPTGDGLVIVNLWRERQGAEEFTQHPDVQEAQKASGLPTPSSFERYDGASYKSLDSSSA